MMNFKRSFKNTLNTRQEFLMKSMNNFKFMSTKNYKKPEKLVKKRYFKMEGVVWQKARDILNLFKGIIIIL